MHKQIEITDAIALRIKEILNSRKKTQYAFVKETGISENTFKSVMKSKYTDIKTSTVKEIIRALNVSFAEFYSSPLFDDGNLVGD